MWQKLTDTNSRVTISKSVSSPDLYQELSFLSILALHSLHPLPPLELPTSEKDSTYVLLET